ncbi:hypothetical protein ANN_01833 [Periplaneta americana]|uniref:Uncharacterized protein n=1 Tax=Periplaneta americana TaxID=6978 RepID=A0ABQ8TY15_PERAM|nr:hypothetical protein ANN_01833 [Periplaneta americana]
MAGLCEGGNEPPGSLKARFFMSKFIPEEETKESVRGEAVVTWTGFEFGELELPLQWKSDSMVDNEENRCLQESLQSPEAATRSSARLVKTPAHLRDFLYQGHSRRLEPQT